MTTVDVINSYFKSQDAFIVIDRIVPCRESDTLMLSLADPMFSIPRIDRILWVNVVGQSEEMTSRLKRCIPIFPDTCNNYVAEFDNGRKWVIRHIY